MWRHIVFCRGALQKYKQCFVCMAVLLYFLVIFKSYEYVIITSQKADLLREAKEKNDLSLLIPMIYEDRSKTLIDKCNSSHILSGNIRNNVSASLINAYPWLKNALFPLLSKSLMYCAIPKIASKTLISLIIYTYVRDIIDYLNGDSTNINVNKTRIEQFIDISVLTEQLRKV